MTAETSYRVSVRAAYHGERSDWAHGELSTLTADGTPPAPDPLAVTSATTTSQDCVQGTRSVPVVLALSGGQEPYLLAGQPLMGSGPTWTLTIDCPGVTGAGAIELVVTDSGEPSQIASASVPINVVVALQLSLASTSFGCQVDSTASLAWSAGGGTAPYRFSLDREELAAEDLEGQADGSFRYEYDCPATAGERSLTLVVTDASLPELSDSESLSLTVTAGPPPLELSLSPSSRHCVVHQQHLPITWEVSGGTGTVSVTVGGQPSSGGTHLVDCPATPGPSTIVVLARDESQPPVTVRQDLTLIATPPLVASAVATPEGCEQGETTEIVWSVAGGAAPYTVTVDGEDQSDTETEAASRNRRTQVECDQVGRQDVVVAASDSSRPERLAHRHTVSLTVSEPETPRLEARIRARVNAAGRAEFQLELRNGETIVPAQRWLQLAGQNPVAANSWRESSALNITLDEQEWTAGRISARLIDTVCPPYAEVTLKLPDGSRLTPRHSEFVHATVALDHWWTTEWLTIELSPAEEGPSGASEPVDSMDTGTAAGPGPSGGLMRETGPTAAVARTAACPTLPANLSLSEVAGTRARLSWSDSSGETGYKVRPGR